MAETTVETPDVKAHVESKTSDTPPIVSVGGVAGDPGLARSLAQINLIIIGSFAGILGIFTLSLVALGVASWFAPAGDPGGVNATHESIKTFYTYILGVFSGIIQARIIGSAVTRANGNGAK